MKKGTEWKQDEIALLKEVYPHFENHELCEKFFPSRSSSALHHKANRLNLHKTPEIRQRILDTLIRTAQQSNYIGNTRTSKGYVYITHLGGGKILEHRLVMESMIGRKLAANEVVHHKNGDKTDNRPDNLELLINGEHTTLHHKGSHHSEEARRKQSQKAKERFKSPENHPNWQGGKRINHNGYCEIRLPDHPRARGNGYVFEHIVIAEQIKGSPLTKDEVVYHINGNKADNSPENLKIITRSECSHINALPKTGEFLICPVCGKKFYCKPSHVSKRTTCSFKCARVLLSKYFTDKPRDYSPTEEEKEAVLCSIKLS